MDMVIGKTLPRVSIWKQMVPQFGGKEHLQKSRMSIAIFFLMESWVDIHGKKQKEVKPKITPK